MNNTWKYINTNDFIFNPFIYKLFIKRVPLIVPAQNQEAKILYKYKKFYNKYNWINNVRIEALFLKEILKLPQNEIGIVSSDIQRHISNLATSTIKYNDKNLQEEKFKHYINDLIESIYEYLQKYQSNKKQIQKLTNTTKILQELKEIANQSITKNNEDKIKIFKPYNQLSFSYWVPPSFTPDNNFEPEFTIDTAELLSFEWDTSYGNQPLHQHISYGYGFNYEISTEEQQDMSNYYSNL